MVCLVIDKTEEYERQAEKNFKKTLKSLKNVIKTLKMEILGQDLKCISSLDEELIYHTTRKNSHHLSNALQFNTLIPTFTKITRKM